MEKSPEELSREEQMHLLNAGEKLSRLNMEKCWVLHRAISLGQQDEGERWKTGQPKWEGEEVDKLMLKYYQLMLEL